MAGCAWGARRWFAFRCGRAAALGALGALLGVTPGAAQDTLSLGDVEGLSGLTGRVPVYVRDVAGTTLDEGDGPGLEIQGFSFRADFPGTWVTSVGFEQAGVTAGKTAFFSYVDPQADHISVLLSFDETTNPLAFTLNRTAPGDPIGNLVFVLSAAVPLNTVIDITLVSADALLSNDSGTAGETPGNGMLALGNGRLTIHRAIFADAFESAKTCNWSRRLPAAICP